MKTFDIKSSMPTKLEVGKELADIIRFYTGRLRLFMVMDLLVSVDR